MIINLTLKFPGFDVRNILHNRPIVGVSPEGWPFDLFPDGAEIGILYTGAALAYDDVTFALNHMGINV